MSKPTHILIVEDLTSDFELAQLEIRRSVKDCVFRQVETREGFLDALRSFHPDVILSDYSLPRFDGMSALKLAKELAPLTPFIIWTGSMSEDIAVECMKAGANNYILKENLKRLGAAIIHSIEERQLLVERKQAGQKLVASEERFRSLIENSLDNISLLAADGTLLWENPAVNRTLGYEQDEFVKRNIFELMHPDDMEWTSDLFTQVVREPGSQQRGTFRLKHQNGTWRWIEATATNMLNVSSVKAVVINYRDITERKLAEIEIQQRTDDLRLINAINEAVIHGENMDGIVNLLADGLKRIFSTNGSTIYMLGADGNTLTMQQYNLPPEMTRRIEKVIGSTIPLVQIPIQEGGFFQRVLRSQHGIITSDPEQIMKWMEEFAETSFIPSVARAAVRKLVPQIFKLLNIRSTITVPLILGGKTIGLLDVSSVRMFTDQDLQRIENISRQLTVAIQRQQSIEQAQRSQAFLQSVQNALSASIAILDEKGVIVQVNSAWRKFGEQNGLLHPEHCIGLNYLEICDSVTGSEAGEAHLAANSIRDVIAGQKREIEIEYPCHSPEEKRWFTLRITKFDDGEHLWVVLAHENITERKNSEIALQESEARYRLISENSTDVIWTLDIATQRFTYVSPSVTRLRGLTPQEVMAQPLEAAMTPESYQYIVTNLPNRLQAFMTGDQSVRSYVSLIDQYRKDGSIVPTEVVTTLLTDASGMPVEVLGVTRDITERKQAEETLRETSDQFRTLFEASPDAILLIEPRDEWRIVGCNTAACQMNGYTRDELIGQPIGMLNINPGTPTERSKYLEKIRKNNILRYEDQHRRKDGSVFPIEVSTSLITVGGREVVLGIDRDITERKQAEAEVRKANDKYRNIFENALEAIHQTTPEGQYITANPATARILGYASPEELLADVTDLNHQFYVDPTRREIFKTLMDEYGFVSGFESEVYRRDGSTIWISENVRAIRDEQGTLLYYEGTSQEITERKKAEAQINELLTFNEKILNNSPVGILAYRHTGECIFVNETAASIVGTDIEHLRSQNYYKIETWKSSGLFELAEKAMKGDETQIADIHLLSTFGKVSWLTAYCVKFKLNEADNLLLLLSDITERKLAESAEREQRTLAEALRDTAETLNRTLDYGEVLDHILAAVGKVVPHDAASILLIEGDAARVVRARGYEERGFGAEVMGVELSLADTVNLQQILETAQPVVVPDIRTYPGWRELSTSNWIRSNVGAPISIHGDVVGFILLDSEMPEFFTPVHAEHLNAFANQAAIAIQNARLLRQAQEEIVERKQAETALRESEEKYRLLFDSNPLPMWIYDLETLRFLKVNDAAIIHYGYSEAEFMAMTIKDIRPSADIPKLLEAVAQVTNGVGGGDVWNHIKKDGSLIHVEIISHVVEFEGHRAELILANDVTERVGAEKELRDSEERFRQLATNIQEVFWITDVTTGVDLYISPAYESIWGRPPEEQYKDQQIFMESILPEDRPLVRRTIEIQKKGKSTEMEYRVIRPDGSVCWIWDRAFPIFDESGNVVRLAGIAADVTERKQAQEALRKSEVRFAGVVNSAMDAVISVNTDQNVILFNPAAEKMFGYKAEEVIGLPLERFIPSRYWTQHKENIPRFGQSGITSRSMGHVGTLSGVRQDGTEFPVEASISHIEVGNEHLYTVILRDITQRKQAEEQLRKLSRAVEQSASTIIITDTVGNIEYANPKFTEVTGYTFEEAVGQNPRILRSQHTSPEEYQQLWETISAGGEWRGEFLNRKKSGELYWESATISPILNEQGAITHFIAVKEDITERKLAEEALHKNEQRLRIALAGTNIAVFNQDMDLRYTWMYQPQLGYTSEQVIGKTDDELLPASDAEVITKMKRRVLETGKSERTEVTIHLDDRTIYFALIVEPLLDSMGAIIGLTGSTLDITDHKNSENEIRRHLAEMEALYENGLAVGQLLNPREIGERIITTFAHYLSWHHVAIRLMQPGSDTLELIAFNQPGLGEDEQYDIENRFQTMISKVGRGLSGWSVQTGKPIRTGNVHAHPQYVDTHIGIRSGLYMPLKIGERIIGVISVESEEPDAFTPQDERLLATLASQAAIAFENARLYQTNQHERERFSDLFENSPVSTWLEDFSAVVSWMDGLRKQGVTNLKEFLENEPEQYRLGVSLIDILDVNHAAVVMNGARNKEELIENVHGLLMDETPSQIMIHELDLIWKGHTSFGFEMTSNKLDGSLITGIQRVYIPSNNNEPDYTRVIVTSTDITDRTNFEKQLRASEVHYRELADSITDIFFELDQELRFSHWNKASEILTGLSAEYAIGKSMQEVFGESDEQTRIGKIYKDVRDMHHPRTFETILPVYDQSRTFEINAYPSTRGVAVVAKDVTERKLSESLMQKRFELMEFSSEHSLEELMQKALDEISEWTHSSIGFFQLIKEDQITPGLQVWSTDTFKHFHSSEVEVMHKPADQAGVWAEAIRQRRAVIHNDYESSSLSGKKGLPEGHAPVIRELVLPIIRNEKIVAAIGVGNKSQGYTRSDLEITERFADYAWDVIERKQMVIEIAEERNLLAKRVEERTSDLSRANSNLARALRVKDEFLANMSHELRTPLNAILGLSESLSEQTAGPLNEKQQKYLNTISESGHHLLSLINDILDLAKIEAGQITLDINKVDVNSVSQASLRMIKQLAQKKNLDVSVEIDENLGLMWADERRLKQMIVNLLSNAVKFTPEGGKLGLQIHGDQDENKVSFTVWDTGIGIKQSDFERLFQPFVQLDSGLARESSGTGLGLALVAQMARLHGGSVSVGSEAGKGSRFTIVLPWEPALAPDVVERMKVTGKFSAIRPGQDQQTILLVEDTQEVVMMIRDYLEIAGYKVATAQDGLDGIAQAKFTHPDLILMDVQMPRMDGLEATKKLRQEPEFRYTPIIALTALAMPNDRDRCIAAGMDEYISKPVNLRGLVKLVQNYLSVREEKTRPR